MRGSGSTCGAICLIGLAIACGKSSKGGGETGTTTASEASTTASSSSGGSTADDGATSTTGSTTATDSSGGTGNESTANATDGTSGESNGGSSGEATSGSPGGGGSAGSGTSLGGGTGGTGGDSERPPATVSEVAYVKSPLLPESYRFGATMDVDGNTLVIGTVPSVQVFVDDGENWVLQDELFGPADNDFSFGMAVAVSGDTIVVGALGEHDDDDNIIGAAYVFVRSGDGWAQQAHLAASNPGYDYFAVAVAIDGDVIALTAPYESSSPGGDPQLDDLDSSGAAYVFERDNGIWAETAILKADNADEFDQFGYTVDVSGDAVIVGAPLEASAATGVDGDDSDNSAQTRGAAYIFTKNGDDWVQQAYLKPSHEDYVHAFGSAVAISGNTAVVATTEEASNSTGIDGDDGDATAASAGAAWVFVRSGDQWEQQAYVKASNTDAGDAFGEAVALEGDWLAVGAPGESSSARGINGPENNNEAPDTGAVYSFVRDGAAWSQQDYIKASNADAGDHFGRNVALSGGTLAVSAEYEASADPDDPSDNSLEDAGAIYVYQ